MSKDMVKRPDHYCFSKFEPKDVIREWKNIFKLRAVGVTGKPHPQMLEVMVPLLEEVKKQIPVVFDDLVTE